MARDRDSRSRSVLPDQPQAERVPRAAAVPLSVDLEQTRIEDRLASRSEGVWQELSALRHGRAGTIRSDLAPAQIAAVLNEQLLHYSAADVGRIIESFPPKLHQHARAALSVASGFATIESLGDLAEVLKAETVFTPGPASLVSNLRYSANRKELFGDLKLTHEDDISKCTATVLDHTLLHRLEREPELVKVICEQKIKLFNPRGFVDGLNMFNTVTPEEIKGRLGTVIQAALEYQASSGKTLTFNNAVRLALDAPTLERLLKAGEQAGVGDALLGLIRDVEGGMPRVRAKIEANVTVKVQTGDSPAVSLQFTGEELRDLIERGRTAGPLAEKAAVAGESVADQTTNENLALRLNGVCGMTPEQVSAELSGLPEGFRPVAAELAVRNSVVYSHRTFALELRALHASIVERAASVGMDPGTVKYAVPEAAKSYGMVTMAYCIANGIPLDQVVDTRDLRAVKSLSKKDLVVVLDDVAGTGSSLEQTTSGIAPHARVVAAPLIATSQALTRFAHVPHTIIWGIGNSPLMAGLDPLQGQIVDLLVGNKGFGGAALCTTFTYMSPDNNSAFWSKHFAPWFTIGGRAVKASDYQPPDADTAQKLIAPKLTAALNEVARVVDQADITLASGVELAREVETIRRVAASFNIVPPAAGAGKLATFHASLMTDAAGVLKKAETHAGASPGGIVALDDLMNSLQSVRRVREYLVTRSDVAPAQAMLQGAGLLEPLLVTTGQARLVSELTVFEGEVEAAPVVDLPTAATRCQRVGALRRAAVALNNDGEVPSSIIGAEEATMAGAAAAIGSGVRSVLQAPGNPGTSSPELIEIRLVTAALKSCLGPRLRSDSPGARGAEEALRLTHDLDRFLGARDEVADQDKPLPVRLDAARQLVALSARLEPQTGVSSVDQLRGTLGFLERGIEDLVHGGSEAGTGASLDRLAGLVWFSRELDALGPAAEEAFSGLRDILRTGVRRAETEIDAGVSHTVVELGSGRLDAAEVLPDDALYRTLVSVAGNDALSMGTRSLATEGLKSIWTAWAADADRRMVAAWEAGTGDLGGSSMCLREIVRGSTHIGELVDESVPRLAAKVELLENYLGARKHYRATGDVRAVYDLLQLDLPRTVTGLDDPRFTLSAGRTAILEECFRRIEPMLRAGTDPSQSGAALHLYRDLPDLAKLFEGERRRQIESVLRDQERFVSLAGNVYAHKVAELMGAPLTPEDIREHAGQFLALSVLTAGQENPGILVEQVTALTLFANGVRRAVERDPSCIGPAEAAAIRPLFNYEFGEGFRESMFAAGFSPRGKYLGVPWGDHGSRPADTDDSVVNRLGYLVNDFQATRSLDPAELRKGVKLLLGEVAQHLAQRAEPGAAPIVSEFVLKNLASGGTGGLGKILDKYTGDGPSASA